MTGITISSPDGERVARSFNDLIGRSGLQRIRRKAVNEIGAKVRKETRSLAGLVFNTSAAALSVRGKAAAPGSDNPAYRLRFAAKIPIARLQAKNRKVTRSQGRARLTLTLPGGDKIAFRSILRRDRASCSYVPGRFPNAESAASIPMPRGRSPMKAMTNCATCAARPSATCRTR